MNSALMYLSISRHIDTLMYHLRISRHIDALMYHLCIIKSDFLLMGN